MVNNHLHEIDTPDTPSACPVRGRCAVAGGPVWRARELRQALAAMGDEAISRPGEAVEARRWFGASVSRYWNCRGALVLGIAQARPYNQTAVQQAGRGFDVAGEVAAGELELLASVLQLLKFKALSTPS